MAKTQGQIAAERYTKYQATGGKLGFWEWRNAGMPAKDYGKPGKDPFWKWDWNSPSLKTTIPTVTSSTTPQWGDIQPTSGFQWNLPGGKTIPTGGLNLPPVSTPPTASPTAPPTQPQVSPGLPGEVGLPPDAQGGYMVMVGSKWFYQGKNGIFYDLVDGQWLPVDPKTISTINAPPVGGTTPITPYQQALLDMQRQQFEAEQYAAQVERDRQEAEARNKAWQIQYESQQQQSLAAIEKQQNELELIKGRAFPFGDETGRSLQAARDMSGAFESARQSILSSLTSPADWIKRWEVQNAANPYTPQPKSRLEQDAAELTNTQTRINMFEQMASESEKLVAQLSGNPDYEGSSVLKQAQGDVANYNNAAALERAKLPARQANLAYSQGQPQEEPPQLVGRGNAPAPSWLPMFAPGQRAGRAISRENVATPSAQQWAGTPWSVQQGLSGYLDWAGYRPMADVLGNMAQMLPNAPGGGSRWSPYIGR